MASAPPQDRPLHRTAPIYPRHIPPGAPDPEAHLAVPERAAPAPSQGARTALAEDALLPPPTGPIIPRHTDALALEPTGPIIPALHAARPTAGELLLHPVKALYMVVALLVDRRVSFVRKLVFVVPIALLILGLFIPETLFGVLSALVAPLVGLALDVPIDAAVDWIGVGLLAYALLRVFPKGIVAQYHARLFHR